MTGVKQIRTSVMMFGQGPHAGRLPQRLDDVLADRLEGVEHAVAGDRHRLEVGRPLDPLPVLLLDEELGLVVGIGRRPAACAGSSTGQPGLSAACSSAIGAALGRSRLLYWMANGILVRS